MVIYQRGCPGNANLSADRQDGASEVHQNVGFRSNNMHSGALLKRELSLRFTTDSLADHVAVLTEPKIALTFAIREIDWLAY